MHYIRLGLRLLCPMTEAAVSAVYTEGSLEVHLVLLPESSENNALQKIIKEEVSGKKRQKKLGRGSRRAAHLQDRRKMQEIRDMKHAYICFRKVSLPLMHHSVFRKHNSFCLQKQKCFIIKGLLLTQNLNSISYCTVPTCPTFLLCRKRQKKCTHKEAHTAGPHAVFQIARAVYL